MSHQQRRRGDDGSLDGSLDLSDDRDPYRYRHRPARRSLNPPQDEQGEGDDGQMYPPWHRVSSDAPPSQ